MKVARKVTGVVISSKDYKEKDKLISLFTVEEGLICASMRGVRGDKAKMKSAKEVFCFGEYVLENTKGNNVVTQVEIIDNFYGLTRDIDKYYEASSILDIINKIATTQASPQLFIDFLKCLRGICYQNIKKIYILDKFLISVFKNLGYEFVTNKCSSCGAKLSERKYFNLDIGEIVCPACKNDCCQPITETCFSALKLLNNTDFEKLDTLSLTSGSEIECLKLLEKNFEWRFGKRFSSPIV